MRVIWVFLWPIRTVLRLIRDIDGLVSSTFAKLFKPRYQIKGACKKRGICCKNIGISLHPRLMRNGIALRFIRLYYEFVYNFTYKTLHLPAGAMLFRCNYLKNNMCSIHRRRPFICRNYPMTYYYRRPSFLPGCGYSLDAANSSAGDEN